MNQIYNFEQTAPPALTEAMLREKLAQKKQTRLLSAAGLLMQLCMLSMAALIFPDEPLLAVLCVTYVILSLAGCGIMALIFTRKRRFLTQ